MITHTDSEDQELQDSPQVGYGCEHFADGRKTWELGIQGWMLRIRGLITTVVLIPLPLAGVPFWWPEKIPGTLTISSRSVFIHLAIVLFVLIVVGLRYLKKRTIRSLEIKASLHNLMHQSRDALTRVHEKSTQELGKDQIVREQKEQIRAYSHNACEIAAHYMSLLLDDTSIGCSIRFGLEKKKNQILYTTIGRSKIFNANRAKNSTAIPSTLASPCIFLSDPTINGSGVIYYSSIEKAAARKAYEITQNDRVYGNDFDSLAVAPINGWNGNCNDLIGILCLTSKGNAILRNKHTDAIRFLADHFAIVYSEMLSLVNDTTSTSSVREAEER